MPVRATTVTEAERARFEREGYLVVEGLLSDAELEMLREEAALAEVFQQEAIRRGDPSVEALNQLGSRYFTPRRSKERPRLRDLVLDASLAPLVRALVGPEAYLFIDVFVQKAPSSPSSFAWHQDHGYVAHYGFGHYAPSTTFWVPLDDVTDENGALHVLPFSRSGARALVPHRLDAASKDCVVDVDDGLGECIEMKAGGLLVMSGLLLHKSGPNRTPSTRRAYQWQYSREPVLHEGAPISLAVPYLQAGDWVGGDAPR